MSSETAQRFGQMLRKLRTSRGLSQLQLAARAGLSENAISAFERAERFPRATTIDALTTALETEVDLVLGDVLLPRERQHLCTPDGRMTVLRQLASILMHRPENQVKMALDLCQRVLEEIPEQQAPAA